MSAMWFDSNAPEMTTAEHCMYLTKFCELIACGTVLENLIIMEVSSKSPRVPPGIGWGIYQFSVP